MRSVRNKKTKTIQSSDGVLIEARISKRYKSSIKNALNLQHLQNLREFKKGNIFSSIIFTLLDSLVLHFYDFCSI